MECDSIPILVDSMDTGKLAEQVLNIDSFWSLLGALIVIFLLGFAGLVFLGRVFFMKWEERQEKNAAKLDQLNERLITAHSANTASLHNDLKELSGKLQGFEGRLITIETQLKLK